MLRIPEPELMADPLQAKAYAAADFSESAEIFRQRFLREFPAINGRLELLDLGCGPAHLPLQLLEHLPELRVHALDGAAAMLDIAERLWTEAGHNNRLVLLQDHLPSPRLPQRYFDILISRSLLHHLADPGVLWSTIRAAGKPAAAVLVMDLVRPFSVAEVERLTDAHVANEDPVLQQDFRASLCAAYTVEEVRAQLREADLDLLVEQVSDRHWLVAGTL